MSNNTYKTVWNANLNALPQDQRGYYKLSMIAEVERKKLIPITNSYRPLNIVANTASPWCGCPWKTAHIANINFSGQETLIGTINGVNANFSLAHGNVDTGTLLITINNAPATNYVISGTSNQNIAFNTAPGNLSVIFAYYAYGDYWYA